MRYFLLFLFLSCCCCYVEIGSDFVGVEFHNFSICPQRISFYYPAANSIDNITDYWTRDRTHIMNIGFINEKGDYTNFGQDEFRVVNWTPYTVEISKSFPGVFDISRKIQFLEDSPSFASTFTISNVQQSGLKFVTELDLQMRTCADYIPVRVASMQYLDNLGHSIIASYSNVSLQKSEVFLANAALSPVSYSFKEFSGKNPNKNISSPEIVKDPWISFQYSLENNGKNTTIVQLIGQVKEGDAKSEIEKILKNYEFQITEFEQKVVDRNENLPTVQFADLQPSIDWAEEILTTSRHYLDDHILPMPCPAEYNFFFTHDTLMTNLARVLYDVEQVKKDLLFIASLASHVDLIIPHAYYWKDDGYVTEFAKAQNWNHMWFNIISARYLRATNDTETIESIFPLLQSSIRISLSNVNESNYLFYSGRPDWWDIGQNLGPKTYHTTLLIEALREFCYLSVKIGKNLKNSPLLSLEKISYRMQESMETLLWDEGTGYLMNYFSDGTMDEHLFTGSLLTLHFRLLRNSTKASRLIETATNILLDPKIGVYNAYPMDFDKLIEKYVFQGNEAGMKGLYFNGGIWNQGNAWIALARIAINMDREEIFKFVRDIVSMEGIEKSPNGQPAYYEYRDSIDAEHSQYGKIDKPQFMWAAGYFLYTLYHLNFLRVDPWNIVLSPFSTSSSSSSCSCFINLHGNQFEIEVKQPSSGKGGGRGEFFTVQTNSNSYFHSAVLPEDMSMFGSKILVELTDNLDTIQVYLTSVSSILNFVEFEDYSNDTRTSTTEDKKYGYSLTTQIVAFSGHLTEMTLLSRNPASKLTINGLERSDLIRNVTLEHSKGYQVMVEYNQFEDEDILVFFFQ